MESASIILKLKNICSDDYAANADFFSLYRDILEHKEFISKTTTNDLYESLCINLDCVFQEARLGDNDEYTEMVYNDCVGVLKEIVKGF